jgi:hypothetical protein
MNNPSVQVPSPANKARGRKPNLILGLIGGTIAMLISAAVLGSLPYFWHFPVSWVTIPLALAVGFGAIWLAKGHSLRLGLVAAGLSLVGCILEYLIAYGIYLARMQAWSLSRMITVFRGNFELLDLLFYAVALYLAFQVACGLRRKAASRPA